MTRDVPGGDEPDEPPEEPPEGRLGTTSLGLLLGTLLVGLVIGWLLRPVAVAVGTTAPRVSWLQPAALYLVAAILGVAARATAIAVRERRRLLPHEAVNRLVLAKACAIVGAFVAGGYLGYALTWVGVAAELAGERIVLSLAGAGGGLTTAAAALLLERACRVRGGDEAP